MKKLAFIFGALLIGFTGIAQDKKGVTITVTIENVLSDEGSIIAGLHTADTFMKAEGIMNAGARAKTGELSLTFENVEAGTFAIMIMHDTNDNNQMDREANGMPKESYGTSGEMNMFGPPNFESSKFEVTNEDQEIRIRF
jgi:uncharacterized protein (DUF2141 family)